MSAAIKFSGPLKEIRLHLCQTSPTSKGVREFMEKYYVELKSSNPKFPILVRECSGVTPKLWARFTYSSETTMTYDRERGFYHLVKKCHPFKFIHIVVEYGKEKVVYLNDLSASDVLSKVKSVIN